MRPPCTKWGRQGKVRKNTHKQCVSNSTEQRILATFMRISSPSPSSAWRPPSPNPPCSSSHLEDGAGPPVGGADEVDGHAVDLAPEHACPQGACRGRFRGQTWGKAWCQWSMRWCDGGPSGETGSCAVLKPDAGDSCSVPPHPRMHEVLLAQTSSMQRTLSLTAPAPTRPPTPSLTHTHLPIPHIALGDFNVHLVLQALNLCVVRGRYGRTVS